MKKGIFLIIYILVAGYSQLTAQIELYDNFVVIKNEVAINSEKLEYSPAFYEDGLVFISTKVAAAKKKAVDKNIDKNMMSIYRAKRNSDGLLEKPEVFASELLSEYHEGPLTFDRTNETVYFSRNNSDKEKMRKRRMQIFSATGSGGSWSNIQKLPFNGKDFETVHPSVSVDGDALYFSSDREGGMGGMDIWVAYKSGDTWSEPINLGRTVNSPGNEVFPFISADGSLYFSSNGQGGSGDLDIFVTNEGVEGWETPTNLLPPFNSAADDFGFIIDRDNKNGYFSSARKDGSLGGDDIYSYNLMGEGGPLRKKKKKKTADLVITDADGNPIEGVTYSYIDMDDLSLGEAIAGTDGSPGVLQLKPSADGKSYTLNFDRSEPVVKGPDGKVTVPGGNIIMKVEKPGYLPQYVTVTQEMVEGGIFIDMIPAGSCMNFSALVSSKGASGLPVAGATVTVTDTETSQQVTLISDNRGAVEYCLECDKVYAIVASQNGQISEFTTVSTSPCTKNKGVATTLYLEPTLGGGGALVAGTVIQLPNIYFNFNDATLRPDAKQDLDAVVAFLGKFPNIDLELASHTDSRGPDSYNKELSQKRSDNTVAYLISQGVPNNRIVAKGYGEEQVTNRCVNGVRCKEAEHQKNRRTEVVITNVGPFEAQQIQAETPVAQAVNVSTTTNEIVYDQGSVVSDGTGQYYVLAGSFKDMDNAHKMVARLQKLGYNDVRMIDFGYKNLMSVTVASFQNKKEANAVAKKLKREHRIKTFVKGLN